LQLNVVPHVSNADDIRKAGVEGAQKIRDALYARPDLFDSHRSSPAQQVRARLEAGDR
jgi:hypothetical protein